ncbi:uncharacterized protein JCM15063_005172 [Sporobolomyces koalae]|uniref:uncharacterized protein n=1 Tax=Sporobolomyces koalae TaxID=500713 RepID=UPI00317D59C1
MASAVSPAPSPPISSSPGSLSSAISDSDSAPNPASPPPPPNIFPDLQPLDRPPTAKLLASEVPTSHTNTDYKRRNRFSTPLILEGVGSASDSSDDRAVRSPGLRGHHHQRTESAAAASTSDGRKRRPSIRTRTLSLSFSPREQAFTPTTPQPSQGTVAASSFPFPSPGLAPNPASTRDPSQTTKRDGRASPTEPKRAVLDRTSSTASTISTTATAASRRPRPVRSSMSRIDPPTRSNSLRVPASVPMSNRPSTSSAEGDASEHLEAKVVILGSQGVGKTSIITRCTTGHFRSSLSSTVGASLLTKKIAVDGTKVRFQIWDPAGQERFRSMAPLYYRGALAAILVYDVTDEASFDDIKIWLEELRKNMSEELIIIVVGAKADLCNSYRTIPLDSAQRQVATWLYEFQNPPAESTQPSSFFSDSIASGMHSQLADPTGTGSHTSPRGSSPSSPNRSRTSTLPSSSQPPPLAASSSTKSHLGSSVPARPGTPSAALDRVRKMSNQLTRPSRLAQSREPSATGSSATGGPVGRLHKHPGLTASMTMPDLGSLTSHSNASSTIMAPPHTPSFQTLPQTSNLNPYEIGMVRSTSNKIGLSLSSLGMSAARRLSHDERMKKTWEDSVVERERERQEQRDAEARRLEQMVKDCPVKVVEVSAKDGSGIEEVFQSIAEKLIVRKAEIEHARVLRSRNSIMLHESTPIDTSKAGWCAC